ncbi:LLM class F420-dependent oxidoreductase [Mycobacterium kyogaense]|uniref:LLM class F420-dependent oxidoreductase n=1 Tax=Mycobacterium kyogaense TaxID=2212479 RepID=UPI000DACB4DD|nr:LLM class F420-dependent oxidoreductase [Mycobacterium kyogaense]
MSNTSDNSAIPTYGVFGSYQMFRDLSGQQLRDIEALGYVGLWAGGSPPADLSWVDEILAATETLHVATGIVNIWTANAADVARSYHRIADAYPGRFVLGIGAGHPEALAEYWKPFDALNDYLDELDRHGVPADRRVVAALGPRVLKLAASRSAGAHPYLTTPEHTAEARKIVGAGAFLAPEQKVVMTTDVEQARKIGREALAIYLSLANYRNNWKRLGFTDADMDGTASDALVDAMIAHGTVDHIAARSREHIEAGANHVAVQILTDPSTLVPALAELAEALIEK